MPGDPVIRALLVRAVGRLEMLCAGMLYSGYPRLTRPPLNLQADEVLGAMVERLLKAMRAVHPRTVREFFALANQHRRWELNDLACRFDERPADFELREELVSAPPSSGSVLTPDARRILEAIEGLPEDERDAFGQALLALGRFRDKDLRTDHRYRAACAAALADLSGRAGASRPASGSGPTSPSGPGRSTAVCRRNAPWSATSWYTCGPTPTSPGCWTGMRRMSCPRPNARKAARCGARSTP